MSRDYAYKKRTGKGVVHDSRKVLTWGRQLLLIVITFCVVLAGFIVLSTNKQYTPESSAVPQQKATDSKKVEPLVPETAEQPQADSYQQPIEAITERTPDNQIESETEQARTTSRPTGESTEVVTEKIVVNQPESESEKEELQFYNILTKPLEEEQTADTEPKNSVYKVESAFILNRVNARSLKALLVFEGFYNTRIDQVSVDGKLRYRLVIEPIYSRSKMNQARDILLEKHDLDSTSTKIR